MDKQRRHELTEAYREQKTREGVFKVVCRPTGLVWLGASRNLDQQQNGIWFQLRMGSHRNKALQAAWTEHGAAAFALEAVEVLEDADLSPIGRQDWLKARLRHWLADLGGQPIIA